MLAFLVAGGRTVSADCRGNVEAAFQNLGRPDRPYRSVMTVDQTYRETTEFIPPDRMRTIVVSPRWIVRILGYFTGQEPIEMIRIGDRTWERLNKKWIEPGLFVPTRPRGMFPVKALPPDAAFACLEAVPFEGTTYVGYQASFRPTSAVMAVMNGQAMTKTQEEQALKALREAPATWRTILLDRESRLPAYEITTLTNELDNPTLKIRYTYPRDLTIEPPVQ
jgi:hypothetical protein